MILIATHPWLASRPTIPLGHVDMSSALQSVGMVLLCLEGLDAQYRLIIRELPSHSNLGSRRINEPASLSSFHWSLQLSCFHAYPCCHDMPPWRQNHAPPPSSGAIQAIRLRLQAPHVQRMPVCLIKGSGLAAGCEPPPPATCTLLRQSLNNCGSLYTALYTSAALTGAL